MATVMSNEFEHELSDIHGQPFSANQSIKNFKLKVLLLRYDLVWADQGEGLNCSNLLTTFA